MSYRDSGAYIPSTFIWDTRDIESIKNINPEMTELFVRLYQNLNRMALAINGKDTGIYHTDEFVTGRLYPPDPTLTSASATTPTQRPSYRKLIDFGALPNTGTGIAAHGITVDAATQWTLIQAFATDPVALLGIPIPYASDTASDSIEIWVDNTNVNITTTSDWSAYTKCFIILEWLTF